MPAFLPTDLVKWLHFVSLSVGGGAAIVALMVSGLEEENEAFQGLAPALWSRIVVWSFRITVLLGLGLLAHQLWLGGRPFAARYLPVKLVLALLLLMVSETGTRSLAMGKRGAALLAILLFLLTSFTVFNKRAFGGKVLDPAPYSSPAVPTLQAR
jgi:hypothetical protein